MGNILVIAEHSGGSLKKTTLSTITAARQLSELEGGEVDILVIGGEDAEGVAGEAAKYGASSVKFVSAATFTNYLAVAYAPAISQVIKDGGYSYALAPASTFGKDLMPRVAGILDAPMASDITGLERGDEGLIIKRPMYAGNAIASVVLEGEPKIITVRQTAFDAAVEEGSSPIEQVDVSIDESSLGTSFVAMEATKSERPELTEARVVISAGRGIKAAENFRLVEELADLLQAAIGASRAAVDAGWAPNDWQVGQTGKIVAPELYIALGISGAIQHLAGMKDSRVIVAINKDEEAPIFQVADYGLVADLFKAVPELIEELRKANNS
jgi:electron transfer flavoprotein alpha subunit